MAYACPVVISPSSVIVPACPVPVLFTKIIGEKVTVSGLVVSSPEISKKYEVRSRNPQSVR